MSAAPLVASAAAAASSLVTTSAFSHTASTSAAVAASVRMSEIMLSCGEGIQLAAQSYQPSSSSSSSSKDHRVNDHNAPNDTDTPSSSTSSSSTPRNILCLHGWMDNCRSFHHLAPTLTHQLNAHVVALDFPGHGWSSHKPIDGPPVVLSEAAYYVHEAIRELGWTNFALIGHSMGAAVSCMYAAAFPELVSHLVLLEGAGPLARNAADVSKHVRLHVERRQLAQRRPPRIYPSLEQAIQTRCATARNFPGNQYLSEDAAREMVLRGTRPATSSTTNGTETNGSGGGSGAGVQFVHDPRLQWPSVQYFTEDQTEGLYKDIQCPTAFLTAEHGWPFEPDKLQRCLDLLQPKVFVRLPGSHHFHADPDTASDVAQHVMQFLQ